MTDSLATTGAFAAYIGAFGVNNVDTARAELMLELASDEVRSYLGQHIAPPVDDAVVTLKGSGSPLLLLPQLPVLDVTQVVETRGTTATTLVEGTDYRVELGADSRVGILHRLGSYRRWTTGDVAVTYSYGYELEEGSGGGIMLPATLKSRVLAVATRGYLNPGQFRQESTGRMTVTHGASHPGLALSTCDKEALARFAPGTEGGAL